MCWSELRLINYNQQRTGPKTGISVESKKNITNWHISCHFLRESNINIKFTRWTKSLSLIFVDELVSNKSEINLQYDANLYNKNCLMKYNENEQWLLKNCSILQLLRTRTPKNRTRNEQMERADYSRSWND